jgi:short subunit dehydrogenase-like uncharacterized protein
LNEQRELDVVVFGATGFVGKLVAEYLANASPEGVRIGLAGRSMQGLEAVRDRLGEAAASWELLVADLTDAASLAALASKTRVLATSAGPYGPRGLSLVEACVEAGTHYADLTGEVLFMRDSIDRYHDRAAANGTKIVHACGVDSIPSDLGVLMLSERANSNGAGELADTVSMVREFRGGFSGGTLATMRGQVAEVASDAKRREVVEDPYALSPNRSREPELGPEPDLRSAEHNGQFGVWLAPFVMAEINTRVVRRSNALKEWSYGPRFRYREALAFREDLGGRVKAMAMAAGTRLLEAVIGWKPASPLLDRVLPAPGEGPSEKARRSGRFEMEIHTATDSGSHYLARIAADADPGYNASSLMLGECALCLALDGDRLPAGGGVLTPATAMSTALVERLRAAGLTLEVETKLPA